MAADQKAYIYTRNEDAALDAQFQNAARYGKVKLGTGVIFWKKGLRWYALPLAQVRRVYRQVEHVYGKMCCGGASFDIQRLILELHDGTSLTLVIGDNEIGDQMKRDAEALFQSLKDTHPELEYGKESSHTDIQ